MNIMKKDEPKMDCELAAEYEQAFMDNLEEYGKLFRKKYLPDMAKLINFLKDCRNKKLAPAHAVELYVKQQDNE